MMLRLSGQVACVGGFIAVLTSTVSAGERTIDFNQDIRPILSDVCYACHGPDEATRKADLRLDTKEGAFADLGGYHAIVPGNLDDSELYYRLTTDDKREKMPPPEFERQLTEAQLNTIKLWIEQGAKWDQHWAFVKPQRAEAPAVKKQEWARNEIDRFILARLECEGLQPMPEADKPTLIRRVTLDLTGLPPTIEEIDAFLADTSPNAYEKVVDRLLASPRYGERMALQWLDLARYADTHGYHIDSHRDMWRWRDWVINAFNDNKPFDVFTIEQLAGDLLPDATLDQQIATGFNRNHMINYEGGAIPEEYQTEYVVDRVNTTSTVWMGLTLACARCHDHKYDPFTMKDYYSLYAFFNTIPENGLDGNFGNAKPMVQAPLPDQQAKKDELQAKVAAAEKIVNDNDQQFQAALAAWVPKRLAQLPAAPNADLVAHFELDRHTADTSGQYHHASAHGEHITYEAGMIGDAVKIGDGSFIAAASAGNFERTDAFSYGGWVKRETGGAILAKMDDANGIRGYDLYLNDEKIYVHIIHNWGDGNAIRVHTKAPLKPKDNWHHILATYDGSSKAAGVRIYVDGNAQELEVTHDKLSGSIRTDKPLHIARRNPGAPFKGLVDDVRIYNRYLTEAEARNLALQQPFKATLAKAPEARTDAEKERIRNDFLAKGAPPELKQPIDQLAAARKEFEEFDKALPTVMVMREMEEPRETFMLVRGSYDQHGDKVAPAAPVSLTPLPEGAPPNRLGLAKWLTDPSHPLTARVAVNRMWQMFFGQGIVKTAEDFGSQGDWPTHPQLLDWLATEFIAIGWDIKAMQKQIVTSAAYRQASRITPELFERDPENDLLAHGPRFRMPAEFIRDQALFASGLINLDIGGPSVYPYQPKGLWEDVAYGDRFTAQTYVQSQGRDLYRRSMYTFWKRSLPHPTLATFDAPDREVCTARRARTNTPLQALILMNDPTYVEASRKLAERMLIEAGRGTEAKLHFAYRALLARTPNEKEAAILTRAYNEQYDRFSTDITAAMALLSVGESDNHEELDLIEHAAWTAVVSMIMNLDEAVTKG